MLPTVAIIGRPNVGKSTLFNRLAGKRLALVDDQPGVTRDWKEAVATLGSLSFKILDTAGLEKVSKKSAEMDQKMQKQTDLATDEADVIFFVIDGRLDLQAEDKIFASWLRKKNKPIILIANKCEGKGPFPGYDESYSFGFGEPVAISAEHGEGLGDLFDACREYIPEEEDEEDNYFEETEDEETDIANEQLKITLLGRPNAGKSTLLNKLLGKERAITSAQAGTTRDAIYTEMVYENRSLLLVDTAGMRKKAKVTEKIEKLSVDESLRAVQYSHLVILLLDATCPLEKQDLALIGHVIKEGRGLILAVNKWDLIKDPEEHKREILATIQYDIPAASHVPLIEISALEGKGIKKLMQAALRVYDAWNKRLPTSELNRWLEGAVEKHTPPLIKGRRLKMRYITQSKSRPPTFILFCSNSGDFPESYLRYLSNSLKETYGFEGCPIRILPRKGNNPYASGKKTK